MSHTAPTTTPAAPAEVPGAPTAGGPAQAMAPLASPGLTPAPRAATARPLVSARTGEVRRPVLVGVGCAVAAVACVWTGAVLFATLMVMTGDDLNAAGWIVGRINPEPTKIPALLMPWLAAACFLPSLVAQAVAAFHSWNGRRWAPWAGLLAAVLSLLTLLFGGWPTWVGLGLHAVAAALLWSPAVRRYHRDQTAFLARRGLPEHTHAMPAHVHYGPLPRYR